MSDLTSVDVELDEARVAFDRCIDSVVDAVQNALDLTVNEIVRLEGVHDDLEAKRQAVRAQIDALAQRADQLEAVELPGPVAS